MGWIFDALSTGKPTLDRFSKVISKNTIDNRVLLNFTFELTPVCNFRCEICYIRMTAEELKKSGGSVLPFSIWRGLADQLAEMGALNCTLTGGECTLHPDFCDIYSYIYDKGILMTVMTNGSNITDKILELFVKKPPQKVFMTLYGASPETYEKFCGNGKYYDIVRENIERLLDKRIPLELQFTAGKNNVYDFEACYEFSKQKNLEFKYTDFLINFNECNDEVIDNFHGDHDEYLRVSKRIWCERKGIDYKDAGDVISPENQIVPSTDNPVIEKGIPCNAGRNSCIINWKGEMQPCIMIEAHKEYPLEKGVKKSWENIVAWSDSVPQIVECQNCIHRLHCKKCIAAHYCDVGEFGKPSPRMCYKVLHPEEAAKFEAEYLKAKTPKN